MFKKLVLLSGLSVGAISFSQNLPTVVSYEVDTICELDFGYGVYNLVIEDLDNDSTFITVTGFDAGLIAWTWVYVPASYDPGSSLRTFQIEVSANGSLPAGVTLSNLTIQIEGSGLGGIDAGVTTTTLNNIGVIQGPALTMDFSSATFCSNGNPVDIAPYVSPVGGNITYANGAVTQTFDPEIYFSNPGDGIVYEYTDLNGCSASQLQMISVYNAPVVNASGNASTCGNADGSAIATITGGSFPYDVYWTTGFSENVSGTSMISNLSSGTYYVNVEDFNGCKAVGIAQISDGDLDVTETISQESCDHQTFDGSILLDVISTNGTVDYVFWNNGQTTEDLTNIPAGDYTVEIHTDMNCHGFYTYNVPSSAPLGINVDALNPADCFATDGIGNSGIQITSWGGSGNYLWDWSNGATTEDIANIPAGVYTCTITDQVYGCSWSWTKAVEDINAPYIYFDAVTQADCNASNGAVDVSIWSPATVISKVWNNGYLTEDLTNVPAGIYQLTVTDINGCSSTNQIKILNAKPYQPSLCLLTVDTSLIYNQIVWEKDITQEVAGFNVYRETATFGVFEQVSSRPYGLESFYQDNIASPIDRSWRYSITTYDDCGNECFPSFIHKTIHVVSNTADGTNFDLTWDDYEGIAYSTVDLFRFDATNGWMNIANLPYGTNTYPDAPPVIAGLDYMVSFNLSDPCTSTKAQDHNSSRSNKTASIFNPGGSTAQIMDEELGYISIYPNPASDIVTLHVDKPELFQSYEITNLNGEIISSGMIYTNNTAVSTENLASGVYLIRLISADKIIVEKLVKK